MEVQIHAIHFDADAKLQQFIVKKISKLEQFYDRITSAEIFLRLENMDAPVKDKVVEIKLSVPGATLFSKEMARSFETSTDRVVDHLRRQLKRHKEKLRSN